MSDSDRTDFLESINQDYTKKHINFNFEEENSSSDTSASIPSCDDELDYSKFARTIPNKLMAIKIENDDDLLMSDSETSSLPALLDPEKARLTLSSSKTDDGSSEDEEEADESSIRELPVRIVSNRLSGADDRDNGVDEISNPPTKAMDAVESQTRLGMLHFQEGANQQAQLAFLRDNHCELVRVLGPRSYLVRMDIGLLNLVPSNIEKFEEINLSLLEKGCESLDYDDIRASQNADCWSQLRASVGRLGICLEQVGRHLLYNACCGLEL